MRKVIAMETKLRAVFAGELATSVSVLCRELGISRQTFYKYRRRFALEGPAGLVERSRQPRFSPGQLSAAVEDEIVRLRQQLVVDNGAQSIFYHLRRAGWEPLPSVSAIHRALRRRGMVTYQPQKRPRSAWKRFVWPHPNDVWQIDATRWVLADRQEVWIMDLLDDHSRLALAARVCNGPTAEAAWAAFSEAASRYGLPVRCLSDRGSCFTGPETVDHRFAVGLRSLGVTQLLSAPYHPQTCGKLERFHQTLKRFLATKPLAASPAELQGQLDSFLDYYNQQRPHRALGGASPFDSFQATPHPTAASAPLPLPDRVARLSVNQAGTIDWGPYQIGVGMAYAGQHLLVIGQGLELSLHGAGGLIRRLTINPHRRYQSNGRPPGRPRRAREAGPCS
jgi:transposase InsO family protein